MTEEMTALEGILQERSEILAMLRDEMKGLRCWLSVLKDEKDTAVKANRPATAETYHICANEIRASLRILGELYRSIRCRWTPGGEHEKAK